MNPQVRGLENLAGTYVFDLRVSNRTLNLNRFLWNMIREDWRARFSDQPEQLMAQAELTEAEKVLIRNKDWLGLVRHGANFFVLDKFIRVARLSNLHVYAIMRGESFEEFLATRRVPEMR